jgi:uncharacterized lipoprotein YmbA
MKLTSARQVLILAASALVLSGCCTPQHVAHWEYKVIRSATVSANELQPDWPAKQEALMRDLAKDGWVLVTESSGYLYFKRPQK